MLISKIENYVLPQGWSKCCLPDFTDVVMGQSPSSDTYNKNESGIPFFQGKAEFGAIYPTVTKYCSAPNKIALAGATLLSVRAPVGPTNLAKEKCCIGRGLAAIHPAGGISPMFVLYLLRSIEADISKEGTGSTFSAINKQFVEEMEFSLPPLHEQHRIVAKIEELFSELDKGIENLKTAQSQLKVYRQALLKHAFEGKLTAQWRAKNRDKLETAEALFKRIQRERAQRYQQQLADWEKSKSPSVPLLQVSEFARLRRGKKTDAATIASSFGKSSILVPHFEKGGLGGISKPKAPKPLKPLTAEELAELPEGWLALCVENLCDIEDGDRGEHYPTKGDFSDAGYCLFLNAKNVTKRGFAFKEQSFISEQKHLVLRKGTLKRGDIVFTSRGTLGNIAHYDDAIRFEHVRINSGMFIMRNYDAALTPDFLYYHLNAPIITRQIEKLQSGTAQPQLPIREFKSFRFVIPGKEEQQQIVQELESKLSEVDQLEQTITTSLQQAEALRQSILKKAFSGQLVPQDPHDEPASVLLARIKAEKTAQAVMAKPRKPKKAQASPAPAQPKVIPFPVRIGNISATDLHAGILARAYRLHAQDPKHLVHFGHVKAEKISHLVEAHLGIDLERMPIKDAAGPNDYPHLKKVESRARKANWFEVRQQQAGGAYVFNEKHGFDALLDKTAHALGERVAEVDFLLKLLLPLNTKQAEIVATLYAAWNNLLLLGRSPQDEDIVYEARENWHEAKLNIEREKFFKTLEWMRNHGLVPAGKGRYVSGKGKRD